MENRRHIASLSLVTLVILTGCQTADTVPPQAAQERSSAYAESGNVVGASVASSNDAFAEDGALFVIDIPQVGLHIPYPDRRIALGDVNDGSNFPERKGEYVYALSRSSETIDDQDGEVFGIHYDRPSDGFGDWSMPLAVRDALMKGVDAKSCALLSNDAVYLPVDMSRPNLCIATLTLNGALPVVIAVGIGRPHEGADFPQSMIVLFAKDRAIVLDGVAKFPQTISEMEKVTAQHMQEHPDTEYPNEQYAVLRGKISALLDNLFSHPTDEFGTAQNLLLSVGRGMRVE